MKKILMALILVVILVVAYWLISPLWRVAHVDEAAPSVMKQNDKTTTTSESTSPMTLGTFVNGVHDVSGTVRVIDTGTEKVLRFENFKTLNGPDLYIYLATENSAKDIINLGAIKGTEGNINYSIPQGTDLNKYSHVLIWCKTFSVLFGSVELR